ncbi:hypothetical protein NQ317_018630 [Molorchus minor]|uniref:Uncharacterized protein n=1 Tax=Molorchus minor TaxID=1323400 RepID=A0ABQ9J2Z9_9CUCU|nr:hypothetical protein NQ317_018630 [Molorchus minor]
MQYPHSLAFSKTRKEIFVSDKWNHCVHIFSSEGEFLKSIWHGKLRSPEGIAMGPNEELVICDTGNDRVVIVNPETEELIYTIGSGKTKYIYQRAWQFMEAM